MVQLVRQCDLANVMNFDYTRRLTIVLYGAATYSDILVSIHRHGCVPRNTPTDDATYIIIFVVRERASKNANSRRVQENTLRSRLLLIFACAALLKEH